MFLICMTSAVDNENYELASLDLSVQLAQTLLAYRPYYRQVAAHDRSLYCLEFFDGSVTYGDATEAEIDRDRLQDSGAWLACAADPKVSGAFSRTAAETLKVTDSGVLWSASPKHGDGEFETVEISWEDLETVAAGGDPFEPATVEEDDRAASATD